MIIQVTASLNQVLINNSCMYLNNFFLEVVGMLGVVSLSIRIYTCASSTPFCSVAKGLHRIFRRMFSFSCADCEKESDLVATWLPVSPIDILWLPPQFIVLDLILQSSLGRYFILFPQSVTTRRPLMTWEMVSDKCFTTKFPSRLRTITIMQYYWFSI